MNLEKLQQTILYLCSKSKDDPKFGSTKLNKLLWFADTELYSKCGKSITGDEYQKLRQGPAPKHVLLALSTLKKAGMVNEKCIPFFNYKIHHLLNCAEPNLSIFSAEEIQVLDKIIAKYKNDGATILSKETHKQIGWRLAALNDIIPLDTVFVKIRPLTTAEKDFAKTLTNIPSYAR